MKIAAEGSELPVMQARITGVSGSGKTTLVLAILHDLFVRNPGKNKRVAIWPADGRPWEYTTALGRENVLLPEANVLDTGAVLKELKDDEKKNAFKGIAIIGAVVDTVTTIWDKALTGEVGGAKALSKAQAMANVRAFLNHFGVAGIPFFTITHVYTAATKEGIAKNDYTGQSRETISETERAKVNRTTWLTLKCVRSGDPEDPNQDPAKIKYSVVVLHCRYNNTKNKPPFTLVDLPENAVNGTPFKGMYDRIMKALFGGNEGEPPIQPTELTWDDYGEEQGWPSPAAAIEAGAYHFITSEKAPGMKFYAWDDPDELITKKDGSTGNNGAIVRAGYVYDAIKGKGKPETVAKMVAKYGKITTASAMAVAWKAEVEERCQANLEAYLADIAKEAADMEAEPDEPEGESLVDEAPPPPAVDEGPFGPEDDEGPPEEEPEEMTF